METTDILVVGGGFGGAYAAREIEQRVARRGVRTYLVAPENFLLFSPLLAEAASGTIEPRHAVIPLRELLHHTTVVAGTVLSIDRHGRQATIRAMDGGSRVVSYRTLVLAPGSVPATRPIPGLVENAVGFKTLADAIWLRNRVLSQLEEADGEIDEGRRREMLTFTFIGGGYAGVEALAELESLVGDALHRYPRLVRSELRWVLIEAQDRLLPGLSPKLASYTTRVLARRGIEVHLSTRLEACTDRRVVLSGDKVEPYVSETIVWTTGQKPSPLVADLGLALDDAGRVIVDDHLRAHDADGLVADVYVVGDSAAVPDPDGGICPGTAQHALRQGLRCGKNVAADYGIGEAGPFTYRTRGLAVTLGRGQGTAQVKSATFRGWPAWWMGRSYHLLMMPGLGRRLRVVSDWSLSMCFPRDIAQLGQLGRASWLESS
jgi:NADH dehydrogenase